MKTTERRISRKEQTEAERNEKISCKITKNSNLARPAPSSLELGP